MFLQEEEAEEYEDEQGKEEQQRKPTHDLRALLLIFIERTYYYIFLRRYTANPILGDFSFIVTFVSGRLLSPLEPLVAHIKLEKVVQTSKSEFVARIIRKLEKNSVVQRSRNKTIHFLLRRNLKSPTQFL